MTTNTSETSWVQVDACTLPTAERPLRLAEFDDLFTTSLVGISRPDDRRVEMTLAGARGLGDRVRDLVDRESSCCSFFEFALGGGSDDGRLLLTIGVPATQVGVLDALVQRARDSADLDEARP